MRRESLAKTSIDFDKKIHPIESAMEIVERKGVGHPDSLSDGIAELASIRYSEYCLARFGAILHHNLDKIAVLGGLARFSWKDGEYVRPVRIVFGGRASASFAGKEIPTREIFESAALEYLKRALPSFDRIKLQFIHLTTDSSKFERWFAPLSLDDLPERTTPRANDTALLTGFAPMSQAELLTFHVESVARKLHWAGSDIKVLVARQKSKWSITTCVPALVGLVTSGKDYRNCVLNLRETLHQTIVATGVSSLHLIVNGSDGNISDVSLPSEGYVTLSGSAIDYGEDGLVGRGNTRFGFTSTLRPCSSEALFGKNPTYHVGKFAGVVADEIAASVASLGAHCRCFITTQIGAPLQTPAFIRVTTHRKINHTEIKDKVERILEVKSWNEKLLSREHYVPSVMEVEFQ